MNHPTGKNCSFRIATVAIGAGMAVALAAAQQPSYTVKDLGTLGGSFSLAYGINNAGQISGFSTLSGDEVVHAFVMRGSSMIDMGTLGGPNSQAFSNLSNRGQVLAVAETAESDPNGEDFCGFGTHDVCLGMVWQNGSTFPLETLGGNNGQAAAINQVGQIAGYAETAIPDPACPAPQVLSYRPVLWSLQGTSVLPRYDGDAEGAAFWINDHGDVVGASGSCSPYDGRYGLPMQPEHALLWHNGQAIDLGNLGGKVNNGAFAINDVGQIVGASDLAGDTVQHAFLWQNSTMIDLGTLPGDSVTAAIGINNQGQITGVSMDNNGNIRAFLWQNGVMFDMNNLIPPNTPLYLLHGFGINDQGQVVGFAFDFNSMEVHGFIATPLGNQTAGQVAASPIARPSITLPDSSRKLLNRWVHRPHYN